MATEFKTKDDEEKDSTEGLSGSTGAVAASPGGQVSAGGANTVPNRTPTGRPNIKQYLQANQGAGQALQQGIQGQVQKQAQKVGSEVGKTQQQLEASSQPLAQKLGEEGSQKIQTAFKDPNALLNQQDQLAEFQKLRSQGYQSDINALGQTAGQQQQALKSQAGQLEQAAQSAGTEAGRFELLRGTYGQPTYSKGQQRLDQLFLQAQPGVARSLQQNLGQVSKQANEQVSGLDAATQAKLKALQGLSSERADQWKNLLTGGASEGLESDISQRGLGDIEASSKARLAQAQQDVAGAADLRQRLATNKLTDEDIQKLGLQKGQSLYDVNLSNYMNQANREATLAGVADPAEAARFRALQQLSGDTSGDIFGGAQDIGNFKAYDYDKDALQAAIDRSQKTYEVEKTNAIIDAMKNAGYFTEDVRNAGELGAVAMPGSLAQYAGGQNLTVDRMNELGMRTDGARRGVTNTTMQANARKQTGKLINNIQKEYSEGKITPAEYASSIQNAINEGLSGVYKNNALDTLASRKKDDASTRFYRQLANYFNKDLAGQRSNVIGGQPTDLENEDPFKVT